MRERASHVQPIEKVLEDANLKLSVVLSDIMGKSGRAVLQAIVDGQTDPERLLRCIGRVKASRAQLLQALHGCISAHHRFMIKLHLGHIDALDRAIAAIAAATPLALFSKRRVGWRWEGKVEVEVQAQ